MTRNLTNYHSHCSLCDGRAPMEDFVREAVRHVRPACVLAVDVGDLVKTYLPVIV